jgi:hypothetical protein
MAVCRGRHEGRIHAWSDDFSYSMVKDSMHVIDLNAIIMRIMGIDHKQLTFPLSGQDFGLSDVYGEVVHSVTA